MEPEDRSAKNWEYEQERAVAERAHDNESEFYFRTNDAAITSANVALRTLVLINGGAAIAILAFIGSLLTKDLTGFDDHLPQLSSPLMWFVWGVALAASGSALAYLTNYCITASSGARSRHYDHPYIRETHGSKRWLLAASFFQAIAVLSALGSLAVFVWGMYEIRDAIVASVA